MRVLVLAQTPIIREGLKALLSGEKDLQVTTLAPAEDAFTRRARASDALHTHSPDSDRSGGLVERVVSKRPDVVLVDVDVLEREGWVFLRDLVQVAPALSTLVISDSPNDRRIAHALELGAHGYLLRDSTVEQMAASIRAAQQGLYVLHPLAAQTLIEPLLSDRVEPSAAADDWFEEDDARASQDLIEPLSERELDVLRLMTRGLANKRIAAELFITEHTVKFHIRSILGKLGATNRTEAVTLALQKGLVAL